MITKERLSIFEKQFGQAVADKNISTFGDAAKYGLDWMYNAMQADVQQGAELIVKWMKAWQAEKDDNAALATENARLKGSVDNWVLVASLAHKSEAALTAENEHLRAALQNLLDEQNGPPLETRRAQWEQAVNEARAILSK